jgi:hypothetical protein
MALIVQLADFTMSGRPLVENVVQLGKGMTVLDLGCGPVFPKNKFNFGFLFDQ